jgi:hypothetical protein
LFILLYFLFAKFSPMISIWEIQEGYQVASHAVQQHHPVTIGERTAGDVHPAH